MKRFYIDESYNQQWGLQGTELLVFATLRALCANPSHSWRGSNQDLADESYCGSHDTASRCVEKLIGKGLVSKEDDLFILTQNALVETQNALISKERTKEREIITINKENYKRNYFSSPPATEQEQASYAGSQYAAYLQRVEKAKELAAKLDANEETRPMSYFDYQESK